MHDAGTLTMLGLVVGALTLGTVVGQVLRRTVTSPSAERIVTNLNARMRAWWIMAAIFVVSILLGGMTTVVLFALSSFLAFREFITLTPTHRSDHRALFWCFFVIIPLNYWLVAIEWYGFFTVFIPVYAFVFIPGRIALAGTYERYLERTSKIQWALMVTVYFLSYVPALLMLEIEAYQGNNAGLLFFFILLVQLNDVLQYVWGNLIGRRKIAPVISPNKTWGGFVGGVLTTTLIGALLAPATPFHPLQAAGLSLLVCLMGFVGDLTMSAVKRDLGVKDFSAVLPGHGGVLDRLDSCTFAAPIFFHVVRYYFATG